MRKSQVDKYTYRVQWSKDDGAHIGRCLEFPSLSADGSTPEEALNEIKFVVKESIKWMKQNKESIPAPLGEKNYNGKYALRMPQDIHRELAIKAAEQGVSLNQYIVSKLVG